MKRAIYYTLVASWPSYKVLAVTSEKPNQVFGRDVRTNEATHRRRDQCIGNFPDMFAAQAKVDAVEMARKWHEPAIEAARKVLKDAEMRQRQAIQEALK